MKKYYLITRILSCDENQIKEAIKYVSESIGFGTGALTHVDILELKILERKNLVKAYVRGIDSEGQHLHDRCTYELEEMLKYANGSPGNYFGCMKILDIDIKKPKRKRV